MKKRILFLIVCVASLLYTGCSSHSSGPVSNVGGGRAVIALSGGLEKLGTVGNMATVSTADIVRIRITRVSDGMPLYDTTMGVTDTFFTLFIDTSSIMPGVNVNVYVDGIDTTNKIDTTSVPVNKGQQSNVVIDSDTTYINVSCGPTAAVFSAAIGIIPLGTTRMLMTADPGMMLPGYKITIDTALSSGIDSVKVNLLLYLPYSLSYTFNIQLFAGATMTHSGTASLVLTPGADTSFVIIIYKLGDSGVFLTVTLLPLGVISVIGDVEGNRAESSYFYYYPNVKKTVENIEKQNLRFYCIDKSGIKRYFK